MQRRTQISVKFEPNGASERFVGRRGASHQVHFDYLKASRLTAVANQKTNSERVRS